MGYSGYIRLWLNGEERFERRGIRRGWLNDISIEAELQSGINDPVDLLLFFN